jgi:hypothetical protein
MRSPGPVHDSAALSLDLEVHSCAQRQEGADLLVIGTVGGSRLT